MKFDLADPPVAVVPVPRLVLLTARRADEVRLPRLDVVGVVLGQGVAPVQVLAGGEGAQRVRLRLAGAVGEPVRLRRGLAGGIEVDPGLPVDSPAGEDDHDEDDCQQEASDGRAHHDQQGQSVWNK